MNVLLPPSVKGLKIQYFYYSKNTNKINGNKHTQKKRLQGNLIEIKTFRNIDNTLLSLLLTLKRFHTFSHYIIVEFGDSCWLGLLTDIKVGISRNDEACRDRSKMCHVNQTDQTTT